METAAVRNNSLYKQIYSWCLWIENKFSKLSTNLVPTGAIQIGVLGK